MGIGCLENFLRTRKGRGFTFFGLVHLVEQNLKIVNVFLKTFVLSIVNIAFVSFSPYLRFFLSTRCFEFSERILCKSTCKAKE
eukprot:UN21879